MCQDHSCSANFAKNAIKGFKGDVFHTHHPEGMVIACIDGREAAGRILKLEKDTIRMTEIAAAIPPLDRAPVNTRAKFGFRALKKIRNIFILGHSFCGGAQTCLAYPTVEEAPEDAKDIVQSVIDIGVDLPRLKSAFTKASEGSEVHAANLLARHLVLVSLQNTMTYQAIDQSIRENRLDIVPLYHRMKQETGEVSELERFDVSSGRWFPAHQAEHTHMCSRPNNCMSCETCHATIDGALTWVPSKVMDANGKIEEIYLPSHTRTHVAERREKYQPDMAKYLKALPAVEIPFIR